MFPWAQPVAFVNARVLTAEGLAPALRFGSRILSIGDAPHRGDTVVDLDGAFVLPGLINAHDHLELNHYGLLKRRERYDNATAWIEDLRPLRRSDPSIRSGQPYSLATRLFIGALKNLLSGVTTVAHHNPLYREIGRRFPVRVLRSYGWAHSLTLERHPIGARGEPGGDVRDRCFSTPADVPFMVHAAEGIDQAAGDELARLDELGCLRPNTVIVHGIGMSSRDWQRVLECGASLVWCPASNDFLFGCTAAVRAHLDANGQSWRHICLGSDSRISGSRDLLDEVRIAVARGISPPELLRMITEAAARILRLPNAGRIAVGLPADLVVLPPAGPTPADALVRSARRDVALVTIGGRPVLGSPSLSAVFVARRTRAQPVAIDDSERLVSCRLAHAIASCPIVEPGVECLS